MTLLPFADCCLYLGVDPKTLRLWLKAANLSCCMHPGDARLKCLTASQLQQLADLHGRCLPHALPGDGEDAASYSLLSSPHSLTASAPRPEVLIPSADADLRQQVTRLQTQVTALFPSVPAFQFHQWHRAHARRLLLAPSRSSNSGLRDPMASFLLPKASLLWFQTPLSGLTG